MTSISEIPRAMRGLDEPLLGHVPQRRHPIVAVAVATAFVVAVLVAASRPAIGLAAWLPSADWVLPQSDILEVRQFLQIRAAVNGDSARTPVVILHGMGDSSTNPGMAALCRSVSDAYPGIYVVCANVANGIASVTAPLADQVTDLAKLVRADAQLADGFHAIGLSQGGLVLRGYVERHNSPPVRRLMTICTPHAGVGTCPSSAMYKLVCPLWTLAPYTARLAFSDYWKDPTDRQTYLERSRWLADINNERVEKTASYRDNMLALERYVLVEAMNDTTVMPSVSESHGFYEWGGHGTVLTLRQTDGYREDALGLRTLDGSGRLVIERYEGDHLQFTPEFWSHTVLPHLGP